MTARVRVDELRRAFVDGTASERAVAAAALVAAGAVIDATLAEDALAITLARRAGARVAAPRRARPNGRTPVPVERTNADDVHALLSCLAAADAGAALEAVVARMPSDDDLALDHAEAEVLAVPRLLAEFAHLDVEERQRRVDQLHMLSMAGRDDVDRGMLRRVLCLVIDDAACRELQRKRAAEALFELGTRGDIDSLRSIVARSRVSVVPGALFIRASLAADPAEAFEDLRESYSVDAYRRRLIGGLLDERADPRWVDAALGVMDVDPAAATSTLAHLRTARAAEELLHLAAGHSLDDVTRHALGALGTLADPRGALLLVRWLATTEGDVIAPLLLTALAGCGDASSLPYLEDRLADAGPRLSYVRHAIESIRDRSR